MFDELVKIQIGFSNGKPLESFENLEVLKESELDEKQEECHHLGVETANHVLGVVCTINNKFIYIKYNKN